MKKKKIDTYVYILIAIFPFALIFLQVFRTGIFELAVISDTIFNLVETPMIEPFYDFFTHTILGDVNNLYMNIAFGYVAYLFYIMLLFLIFDVLLWFIKFCGNLVNKFFLG